LRLEIWFLTIPKKKFKHKFFILDCVPIDPSNVASTNIEPDVVIDLTQVEIDLANSKKRKKMNELNRHFQDSWAAKLP
jgi:hypothetical protein